MGSSVAQRLLCSLARFTPYDRQPKPAQSTAAGTLSDRAESQLPVRHRDGRVSQSLELGTLDECGGQRDAVVALTATSVD